MPTQLQVWKATVYLTPLVGAYLADAVMGRFWVILVFSTIYMLGMLGITLVNIIPAIKPGRDIVPPAGIDTTRGIFWVRAYRRPWRVAVAAAAGGPW
jgi:dipeptide/tripeptide permease